MLSPLDCALVLAVVALVRLLATHYVHVYDDAFITFRYARNLGAGLGLVFNPGAPWEPVLGTTAPGYALLLGWFEGLGIDAATASRGLNLACDLFSASLLLSCLRARPLLALLAVSGFACMPELVRISVGSMEAPLLLALLLGALCSLRSGHTIQCGVLVALCCTVRPESVLLVAVLAWELRRDQRELARFLLPVGVIGALVTATLVAIYGTPIPNSVTSKAERHGASPLLATWLEIARQGYLPRLAYLPALALAIAGSRSLWRSGRELRILLAFGQAIVLAYFAAHPHTWGWYYFVPLTGWTLAVAFGLEGVLARAPAWHARALFAARPLLGLTVAGLAIAWFTNERVDRVTEQVYRPMEHWAKEVGLGENQLQVLASDVGAISWFGGGPILDSEGLTLPMKHVDVDGEQAGLIREFEPPYLMITAVREKIERLRMNDDLYREYYPVRRFSSLGETQLEPTLDELPESWVQDYIIYRRR